MALPGPDARVVVVVPHPDDEVLGAGGLIAGLVRQGTPVTVVYVTSGDGYHEAAGLDPDMCPVTPWRLTALAAAREDEARTAAARLGMRPDQLRFLGFPDGGLDALWGPSFATPWQSPHTAAAAVPYRDAVAPGAPYTGQSLLAVLAGTLATLRPTLIVTAHPRDAHADHAATGWFAIAARARVAPDAALRLFLVHDACWPPVAAETTPIPAPPADRYPDTRWEGFDVPPADRDATVRALDAYRTQLAVMPGTLYRFLGPRELFGTIPDAALADGVPPPGTLPPPRATAPCPR